MVEVTERAKARQGGVFSQWQPVYADHKIATFPCGPNKTPAVRNYGRFGLRASSTLASRFPSAGALGFMCGGRSGITVLDVDSSDERVLADAIDRHGKTRIVVRTGSGHFQAWYRHAGERRLIRPRRNVPIDILGAGYVVAPPSRVEKGDYQFIEGCLDDLDSLPTLIDAPSTVPADVSADWADMRKGDGRNNALFRLLGRAAHNCDDFEQILDYARTQNDQLGEPMPDAEVLKVAKSVWKMQCERRNWFGKPGVHLFSDEALPLIDNDPDLLRLLMFIKSQNRPGRPFMLTNSFHERWGWSEKRLARTRKRGLKSGYFRLISPAYSGHAAFYSWGGTKEDN
jgi:hypothetical protein